MQNLIYLLYFKNILPSSNVISKRRKIQIGYFQKSVKRRRLEGGKHQPLLTSAGIAQLSRSETKTGCSSQEIIILYLFIIN